MARPNKIPTDPEILDYVVKNMALGLSSRLIAEAIGENPNTVKGWKRRKDFNQKLAKQTLEILAEPIEKVRALNPIYFLQTHHETKEAFTPPAQNFKGDISIVIKDCVKENG